MKVKLSTILESDIDTIWINLQQPKLLDFIAKPLVKFTYLAPNLPKATWEIGKFATQMSLFGIIPIGKQTIRIEIPDNNSTNFKQLRDNGYGQMIKKWDHLIILETFDLQKTKYTDEINIEAGILTPFVWCFAFIFYNWRQFRWKKLIKQNFKQIN